MDLEQLLEGSYDKLLELFPEFATRQGVHLHDHLLSDPSPAGNERYRTVIRGLLDDLRRLAPGDVPPRHRTSYELCLRWLENEAEGFAFPTHLLRIDPLQGFQLALPNLFNETRHVGLDDYQRLLERLGRVPAYVDAFMESTREGLRQRFVQARPAVEKVIAQLRHQVGRPAPEHPFYRAFTSFPAAVGPVAQTRLQQEALKRIEAGVIPALRRLLLHLEDDYLPASRQEPGIASLPQGQELYAWLVRRSTTTRMTPEEVHRVGLSEVNGIRKQMEAVKEKVGFQASLGEFFQSLRTDRRFYHERKEDLLEGYREIARRADAELPRFFGRLPRTPYVVLPIPDYAAASNTTAYYQRPPADGSLPGHFYANTHDLSSRPRYEMEALALHEAVPGHHLQLAIQLETEGLPRLRTRWLFFGAFVEGWALYAERLGKEMGFYTDPYSEFGRLTYDMWRTCRLVVDTGLHHLGWSRARAVEVMVENTALSRLNIESEVDRYMVWPGQALAYKIGELKVLELRRRAEAELGAAFDLRAFHDCVLCEGALPLDLLSKRVEEWIESARRALPR